MRTFMGQTWVTERSRSSVRSPRLEHIEGKPRLLGHAARVPGRIEHKVDLHLAYARNGRDGVLHPAGHVAGHRAAGGGQGHVHLDIARFIDVQPVDQAKLIDVDRDLGIEHGLQRRHEVVLELVVLGRGRGCGLRGGLSLRRRLRVNSPLLVPLNLFTHFRLSPQANISCALCSASTSRSTSSSVLYMAKEARAVEVTPYRAKRGSAQWV